MRQQGETPGGIVRSLISRKAGAFTRTAGRAGPTARRQAGADRHWP